MVCGPVLQAAGRVGRAWCLRQKDIYAARGVSIGLGFYSEPVEIF